MPIMPDAFYNLLSSFKPEAETFSYQQTVKNIVLVLFGIKIEL